MKILKTLDDIFAVSDAKRVIIASVMDTKIFWRLYFWWGIRKAKQRRLTIEKRLSELPKISNDEYWEKMKKDK